MSMTHTKMMVPNSHQISVLGKSFIVQDNMKEKLLKNVAKISKSNHENVINIKYLSN